MIKDILLYPKDKEILTQESQDVEEINDEVKSIVQDLIDTLKSTDGVGISAVQIGILKNICVVEQKNGTLLPMINPKITRTYRKCLFKEGCLSAPGVYTTVERAKKITCTYIDLEGNLQTITRGGMTAIIIQHELDHLLGWCPVFEEVKKHSFKRI